MSITFQDLRQCRSLMQEIDVIEQQIKRLGGMKQTSGDVVLDTRSGLYDPDHAKMWQQTEYLEKLYRIKVLQYGRKVMEVEEAIGVLPSLQRTIIRLRYVVACSWGEIQQRIGYERSQCFTLHSAAVAEITLKKETG